jgi:hypothetical protein
MGSIFRKKGSIFGNLGSAGVDFWDFDDFGGPGPFWTLRGSFYTILGPRGGPVGGSFWGPEGSILGPRGSILVISGSGGREFDLGGQI